MKFLIFGLRNNINAEFSGSHSPNISEIYQNKINQAFGMG